MVDNHKHVVFCFTVLRLLWCLLFVAATAGFALRANGLDDDAGSGEKLFCAAAAVLCGAVLVVVALPASRAGIATLAEFCTVDDCLAEVCDTAVRMENHDQVWVAILATMSVRLGLVHKKLKGWCVRDDRAFVIETEAEQRP